MEKRSTVKRSPAGYRLAFFALLVMALVTVTLHVGSGTALAGQATLSWTAPTTNADGTPLTDLAGYNVYIGSAAGSYQQKINAGNVTSYTASNLTDGSTSYFAVTAYDTSGLESTYSNQVSKALPMLYAITATAGSGGTISALSNSKVSTATNSSSTVTSVTVTSGASQSFSITPSTGYTLQNVTVDGTSVGAVTSYSFSNVTASHSISATFAAAPVNYTITASAGTGGAISPSGSVSVASGGSQTFTITPASGYQVAAVTVDGASLGAVTTCTLNSVAANHTVSATFTAAPVNYTITASAGTGGSISPSGSSSVSSGASKSFTITPSTGYSITGVTVDGASVGAVSSYTFSSIAANHTIQASFAAASSGTGSSSVVFATNAAGPQYVSSSTGVTYQADTNFSGGGVGSTTATISGTSDGALYKTERWGNCSYNIPVANGNYNVTLKFAEIYFSAAGKRVFNVTINGQTVISNLDIYAKVGKNAAYDVVVPVNVTNGTINISFVSQVDYAKVSAIKIAPAQVVFATNSAGPQYTSSSAGTTYQADTNFSGGGTGSTTATISGTTDGTLYQTERWGNFSYSIPVANGNYALTLKFAEIYWSAAGKRVFSVGVNGQTVISNLDIYANVGKNAAYDVVIPVTVTNGAINVNFTSQVDYAKVDAILLTTN